VVLAADLAMYPTLYFPVFGHLGYARKLRRVCGSALIAHWPQWEASGATAFDQSGHGYHGAITGCTLGAAGMGDSHTAFSYDGATCYTDIYSAGFAAAFNGHAGTVGGWWKPSGTGIWSDGTARNPVRAQNNGNNSTLIAKDQAAAQINFNHVSGSVSKQVVVGGLNSWSAWFFAAYTWDEAADKMIAYWQGQQTGATQTGLGVWTGALNSANCNIGCRDHSVLSPWSGLSAHVFYCNAALTAANIAKLYNLA
jgi:hypothetical protein